MTQFRLLLAGHDPRDPAEATLVLAAVAAFHGLRADGSAMPNAEAPVAPSLRQIAGELGLHVGAVRRGVRHLAAAGAVHVDAGVHVTADVLRARWAAKVVAVRLSSEARELELLARPLLVAGVVAGQIDQRGRLVMGLDRLGARTGLARRTLQRAVAAAEAAGALHHWTIPVTWLSCFALGRRREVAQEKGREVAQENQPPPPPRREVAQEKDPSHRREVAHPPSRIGAPPRREVAHPPSRSGASTPGLLPESDRKPSDARARAKAEDASRPAAEPEPESGKAPIDNLRLLRRILLDEVCMWSRLAPLDRAVFANRLAKALDAEAMQPVQLRMLWAKAQRAPGARDPIGILAQMLAGHWRAELDAAEEQRRHAVALARGTPTRAAERRDGHYGGPLPAAIGAGFQEFLAKVNHA